MNEYATWINLPTEDVLNGWLRKRELTITGSQHLSRAQQSPPLEPKNNLAAF